MLWASPNVITAWLKFRTVSTSRGDVLLAMDQMYGAIRKDLGNSNRTLKTGDLIRIGLILCPILIFSRFPCVANLGKRSLIYIYHSLSLIKVSGFVDQDNSTRTRCMAFTKGKDFRWALL